MNILLYSYFPVRNNHWAGGAQAFLGEILPRLLDQGFRLRIVFPRPSPGDEIFSHPQVVSFPVLDEPEAGPLKLDVRARNLAYFREHLAWAETIWTIDEPFPLRVPQPVVSTLQTADGFEENQSILTFNWDTMVTASPFLADCVREIARPSDGGTGLAPEVQVVANGVDLQRFRPTDATALARRLGLPPGKKYVLFPHRPEVGKGFGSALKIARLLADRGPEYLLLIPMGPKCVGLSREKQARFYAELRERLAVEGLEDILCLHEWISPQDMPAYLSLGHCCLVLSQLPEGFGFIPVQALACGTPVVSTKCGALRGLFPEQHGIGYFVPDEVEGMIHAVLNPPPPEDLDRGRRYVERHYAIEGCASRYAEILSTAVPRRSVQVSALRERIHATPWWFRERLLPGGGLSVWHDLQMRSIFLSPERAKILETAVAEGSLSVDRVVPGDLAWLIQNTLLSWS